MSQPVEIKIAGHSWHYEVNGNQIFDSNQHLNPTRFELEIPEGLQENLRLLLSRRRKEIFRVSENGQQLEKIRSLRGRVNYWWNKRAEQKRLKPVISAAIEALNNAIEESGNLSGTKEMTFNECIKGIFFKGLGGCMARLPTKIFDRSVIKYGGKLEGILDVEQLRAKRANFKAAMAADPNDLDRIEKTFYSVNWEESQFAEHLGVNYTLVSSGGLGGSGGARFGYSRSNKKITVIKPGDEGPYGEHTPSLTGRIKKWLLSPRSCLHGNSEPRAEHGSSCLSQRLKLYNVPMTQVEGVRGDNFVGPQEKECSVQLFAKGAKTLDKFLEIPFNTRNYPLWRRPSLRQRLASTQMPDVPKENFEYAALLKFLSGDIDTHFENMLGKKRDENEMNHAFLNTFFAGNATKDAINTFVDQLFENDNHYHLLDRLLNRKGEDTFVVNHDGGAAFVNKPPSSHYTIDGYLSSRFRFLFETHPTFNQSLSGNVRIHFLNQREEFAQFILETAIRELIGVSCHHGSTYTFVRFWEDKELRARFKRYILGEAELHTQLKRDLARMKVADTNVHFTRGIETHFDRELTRIKGVCDALSNRYRLLLNHLEKEEGSPSRNLFTLVHEKQIQNKLPPPGQSAAVDAFNEQLRTYKEADCMDNIEPLPTDYHALQHVAQNHVRDFIEG